MEFKAVISVYNGEGDVLSMHMAEFSHLPEPKELEMVCWLVMADGHHAIATVHHPELSSILYGMICEGADNDEKE